MAQHGEAEPFLSSLKNGARLQTDQDIELSRHHGYEKDVVSQRIMTSETGFDSEDV